ncbi:nickel-dependent hydrogenase large subunit [Bradyrhizobium yuanmingense]|uniref:nickel-dependent hydrogenase large subunit n=1 Tax=Bradyrhizobium yuanmingense TaxID=108015 RepID=UPI0023B8A3F0|nr:nickel-dependent hydrogenase large subunit [Bradyrhizobium yuanmingense]MDF0521108.1 nickel-dependent hydrogenase large subunit [Bradyrhizobium yuanmingense]
MRPAVCNRIDITVSLVGDTVAAVGILPRVKPPVGRLFAGKPAVSLLDVLPRLFPLCAAAHRVAFLSAIEAARGQEVSTMTRAHCTTQVVVERLTELIRGLIIEHLALDISGSAAIRALIKDNSVLVGREGYQSGPDRCAVTARVAAALAGLRISDDDGTLMPGSALALRMAALEGGVLEPKLTQQSFLSAADDCEIIERLLGRDARSGNCPDLEGRIPETGPWARQMLRDRLSLGRSGPAERLKARIAEIVQLFTWLKAGAHPETAEEGIVKSYSLGRGCGAAGVECARGRLYHAVELDRYGQIARFEYLAPTEWNFHKRGPLARSLQGAVLRARQHQEGAVRAMIASFDPCVAFTQKIVESGHA